MDRIEYIRLLDRLWFVSGIRDTCRSCIKSAIDNDIGSSCCGSGTIKAYQCANLTETGCKGKPLGCAAFTCWKIKDQPHWPVGFKQFLCDLMAAHPVRSFNHAIRLYNIETSKDAPRDILNHVPFSELREWIRYFEKENGHAPVAQRLSVGDAEWEDNGDLQQNSA